MVDRRVYIAGPYTLGDIAVNVATAMHIGSELMDAGYSVYVPHLSHFMHMLNPKKYERWLEHDIVWLSLCNIVLRLEGESKGADKEVLEAKRLGIPVYYSLHALLTWPPS